MSKVEMVEKVESSQFDPAVRVEKVESPLGLTLSTRPATPRELMHFLLLPRDRQIEAIRRLHATGMGDHDIARVTRLSVVMVRRLLAEVTLQ